MDSRGETLQHCKIETLQEKVIRIIKLLSNNAPVSKEVHKLKILKLQDLITLQNILSVAI